MSRRCLLAVGSLCFGIIIFSDFCSAAAELGTSLQETLAKGVAPGTTVTVDDAAGPVIAEVSAANLRGEPGGRAVGGYRRRAHRIAGLFDSRHAG